MQGKAGSRVSTGMSVLAQQQKRFYLRVKRVSVCVFKKVAASQVGAALLETCLSTWTPMKSKREVLPLLSHHSPRFAALPDSGQVSSQQQASSLIQLRRRGLPR